MNVLILSDFSEVAINATHYALDLLQNEQATFTLLNIHVADKDASARAVELKRQAVQSRLQERVQKLQERSKGRPHTITGHYSEDKLINAARDFIKEQEVDFIVMGAVGKKFRHSTILGNHTYEIMSKVKCNILAVPDDMRFEGMKRMLMPVDYSASLRIKNLQFLIDKRFLHNIHLSIWEVLHSNKENGQRAINKEIFNEFREMEVDFYSIVDSGIYDKTLWKNVQKKFDLVVLLGRNLKICNHLMHNKHGLYTSMPNRLPILVLHD